MTNNPFGTADGAASSDSLKTLLDALEQQLTRHFIRVASQIDEVRTTTEAAIADQAAQHHDLHQALTEALEGRLAAFAEYQHAQLIQLDGRISDMGAAQMPAVLQSAPVMIDHTDDITALRASLGHTSTTIDASLSAIAALTQRLSTLEQSVQNLSARVDELSAAEPVVDTAAIDELRVSLRSDLDLTTADLDRAKAALDELASDTDERIQAQNVRIARVETQIIERPATAVSVQLDRLDELERQITTMAPDRRIMRDVYAAPSPTPAPAPTPPPAPAPMTLSQVLGATSPTSPTPPTSPSDAPSIDRSIDELAAAVTATTESAETESAPATPAAPPVILTRTIAAPPAMSLTPRLPSAQSAEPAPDVT